MSDGLPADCVLLVVEGDRQEGGSPVIGQGCVVCSKATGFDEKLNISQTEGVQMSIPASLEIFSGTE